VGLVVVSPDKIIIESRSVLELKVGGRVGKRRVGSQGFENVRVFEASSALAVRF